MARSRQPRGGFHTALTIALLLVLVGMLGQPAAASRAHALHAGGTLVVGYEADVTSLDPGQPIDINSMHVLVNMYDTLVQWSPTNVGQLAPDLATSWSVSSDGLTYTLQLRKGVKFQDGTPFNADAVAFTFDRMLDPKNPYYKYGPFPFASFFYGEIASIKPVGPYTVRFTLSKPTASFMDSLTIANGSIVSPAAVAKYKGTFALHGGGTGAFSLQQWQRGVQLVLQPNPNYWQGAPALGKLIFVPIVQPDQRVTALQAGTVNAIVNPSPVGTLQLQSNPNYHLVAQTGPHIWWVGLNLHQKPFDNVLVRRALNYAIDRKGITQGVLYGTGAPTSQPLSPGQLGYNSTIAGYTYDPAKAKALLAQAGYPNGFSTTFLVPTSGSGMQDPVGMGTAIQRYLGAVGIKVKIVERDWGSFLGLLSPGADKSNMSMWELSWMDSAVDPALVLNPLLASSSFPPGFDTGFYKNPKVDQLLAQGELTTDLTKRAALYSQAEALIVADAPWIFVDHAKAVVAYAASVHGLSLNTTFPFLLYGLRNVTVG
jgi:peptide/nickel transport system substrate-binding protein